MIKRVKDFCKAHAADVADTLMVTGGSILVISVIMFGRIVAFMI